MSQRTAPASLTGYIFHPRDVFEIANQDVGDAQGDVTFVCEDVLKNGLPSNASGNGTYQIITQWTIEHMSSFGQYQNCIGCARLTGSHRTAQLAANRTAPR